tara:strand:+ start:387 stop:1262 length:876 start_codon:yes stop_codon:yes gene_type:complete
MEAPIEALKNLKVKYVHKWSCDIDKSAKKTILANHKPEVFFDNIMAKRFLPKVNIYVAGFPCQTFSSAGNREGMKDKARGCIFNHCVKAIKQSDPDVFILENVKGLLSIDGGNTFKKIIKTLEKLKVYKVIYKILNSNDYGTPQNRNRVFILGIKTSKMKKEFEWPKPKKLKFTANELLAKTTLPKRESFSPRQQFILDNCEAEFCDFNFKFNKYTNLKFCIPPITTHPRIFSTTYKRFLTTDELLIFQGFNPKVFKRVVPDSYIRHQIGNSMTVTTLTSLFKNILDCVKF